MEENGVASLHNTHRPEEPWCTEVALIYGYTYGNPASKGTQQKLLFTQSYLD